jgi:DNA-binding IclR family transcriptional regulator
LLINIWKNLRLFQFAQHRYTPYLSGHVLPSPQALEHTGSSLLSNISIRNIAHQYMEEMSQYVQAPVAMATRDRLNMVNASSRKLRSRSGVAAKHARPIELL